MGAHQHFKNSIKTEQIPGIIVLNQMKIVELHIPDEVDLKEYDFDDNSV